MQLLDAEDPALILLQEALKKAKAQAPPPPLANLISDSETYVARKMKRLEEAEEEILEAIKRRDVLKAEVVAGEERLVGLQAEVTRGASVPLLVTTDVGVGDEIAHLKARLAAAKEERDAALRSKFIEKTSHNAPNQRGSHTDRPHPSHAVFGANRIESVVVRSTIRSPGNPRIQL